MKSQKSLTRLLKNAAAFESPTQLFSEDELRTMLENATVSYPPNRVHKPSHRWRNIMFGSTILAGATAALMWFSVRTPEIPQQDAAMKLNQAPIASHQLDSQPIPGMVQNTVPPAPQTFSYEVTPTAHGLASEYHQSTDDVGSKVIDVRSNAAHLTRAVKVKGIHAVELSDKELEAIGIKRSKEGYTVVSQLQYNQDDPVALNVFASNSGEQQTTVVLNQSKLGAVVKSLGYDEHKSVLSFSVQLDSFAVQSRLEQANSVGALTVYPLLVSHDSRDLSGSEKSQVLIFGNATANASEHNIYSDELSTLFDLYQPAHVRSTRELSTFPLLSKLVAVRIQLGDADTSGADILLWYYPSDEFISLLPKKVGSRIRQERDLINDAEQRHLADTTKPLIEPRFTGDYTYTDVNRAHNGALESLSVGPNPARDIVTLRYSVTDQRQVQIMLYDMSGRYVSTLNSQMASAGTNDVTLDLNTLSSGAYLLSIVSDHNEQAIQRFIIQK